MKSKWTFQCKLINNDKIEQDFLIILVDLSLVAVLDRIESILTHDYGWITKRTYTSEKMGSDRYWDIILKFREILDVKNDK